MLELPQQILHQNINASFDSNAKQVTKSLLNLFMPIIAEHLTMKLLDPVVENRVDQHAHDGGITSVSP